MSIIQDKIGNEFLRNGAMEPNFAQGMIMFSHLPPVTSFTRLAAQSGVHELQPPEMVLKKERDSPDGVVGVDYAHAAGIKQEKLTEHDFRLPLYPGGVAKAGELLEVSLGNHQSLLVHDLSLGNVPVAITISFTAVCFFIVGLSLYSDPWNTGSSCAVTLSGVPVYYLTVHQQCLPVRWRMAFHE